MLSKLFRTGTVAVLLLTAGIASAAEPATHNHYRAKQVLGTKIILKGESTAVGTVDDLVFDDAGNLEYLIVDNGGKLTTVPFEAAMLDVEKKQATLVISPDQYKLVPTYTTTTYPSFYTPTYRNEIYKTYGVTPRELRVINRRR
jgi:sporulation protein YlmC with PRC-barrel domain